MYLYMQQLMSLSSSIACYQSVKMMTAFYLDWILLSCYHCLDFRIAFNLTNRIQIINILPSTALFCRSTRWDWENSLFVRIFTCFFASSPSPFSFSHLMILAIITYNPLKVCSKRCTQYIFDTLTCVANLFCNLFSHSLSLFLAVHPLFSTFQTAFSK